MSRLKFSFLKGWSIFQHFFLYFFFPPSLFLFTVIVHAHIIKFPKILPAPHPWETKKGNTCEWNHKERYQGAELIIPIHNKNNSLHFFSFCNDHLYSNSLFSWHSNSSKTKDQFKETKNCKIVLFNANTKPN